VSFNRSLWGDLSCDGSSDCIVVSTSLLLEILIHLSNLLVQFKILKLIRFVIGASTLHLVLFCGGEEALLFVMKLPVPVSGVPASESQQALIRLRAHKISNLLLSAYLCLEFKFLGSDALTRALYTEIRLRGLLIVVTIVEIVVFFKFALFFFLSKLLLNTDTNSPQLQLLDQN
jgi:hypothetical protein